MFLTKPNLKHIIIANVISGIVSLVMVGAVLYSWTSQTLSPAPAILISYGCMVLAWIFLFTKVHRAIDINAREVSFKQHVINSLITSLAATGVFLLSWTANFFSMPLLSSIALLVGLGATASLQILLYIKALRKSSELAMIAIK